ncbi:MFS transporter [Bacillus sp. PAMC26568]|nr:MFS transporter [Bacillus sp. PAMC26568]
MKQAAAMTNTLSELSHATKLLLAVCCLNTLANSLSAIFINVFLFRVTEQFEKVALFNLMMYIAWLPAFIFAGWLSKRVSKRNGLMIGGLAQFLFYLFVFFLEEKSTEYIISLGILFGFGSGFYWMAVNVLSVDYTQSHNRDWFNSVNGMVNTISQMLGPLVSGWLIVSYSGLKGYSYIFGTSFILFFVTFLLGFYLPKSSSDKTFYWKEMMLVHRSKAWRSLTYAFMANAFRGGVISFAILVWVYSVTRNESSLGMFSFMTTSLSLLSYYLIGRYGKTKHRLKYMLYGNILFSAALIGLVFEVSWEWLLIYGVISGICIPLFELPFHTIALNNIEDFDQNGKLRIELVVVREAALSVGRIASVFLLYLVYSTNEELWLLKILLVLIIIIGLTPHYFLKSIR